MSFHYLFIPLSEVDNEVECLISGKGLCEFMGILDAINDKKNEPLSISEMHSIEDGYRDVGQCLSLAVLNDKNIAISAIIHKPNTITKIQYNVLSGFSIKFDLEHDCIVDIALVDAPVFQDEDDCYRENLKNLVKQIEQITTTQELEESLLRFLKAQSDSLEKKLVEKICGVKIEIYPNDHQPPHFHIRTHDNNYRYTIDNCQPLSENDMNISRQTLRRIQDWHKNSINKLYSIWENTRPG
jgi:hypothetical protein